MYAHRLFARGVKRTLSKIWCRIFGPTVHDKPPQVRKWYAAGGDLRLRYNYPLNDMAVIFDVGGYEGEFADRLYTNHQCTIHVFEPVVAYASVIRDRFRDNPKVRVHNFGLAGRTRYEDMSVEGVTSSTFRTGLRTQVARLVDIKEFCHENDIDRIDLIKINIEGGEYELLERILDTRLIDRIHRIQVQFHNVSPTAEARMGKIQRRLSKTHRLSYQFLFVWENWVRKDLRA